MAKVLIVDDSPTEIQKIKSLLKKSGHDVIEAMSGEEGIDVAKSNQPDVVLMDIVMPGLNGFQATRQLTQDPVTKHIPVVIVTSKTQETDKLWGKRQGARGYLVKPLDEKLLARTIKDVIAEA